MENDPASLSNLRDIIEPAPVAIWPLATGLTIAVTIAAVWLVVVVLTRWVRWRHNAYRRQALAGLDALATSPDDGFTTGVNALLKRTALAAFPREDVAQLAGDAWLRFLDITGGTTEFTQGPGSALGDAVYRNDPDLTKDACGALAAAAHRWIAGHRPPPDRTG